MYSEGTVVGGRYRLVREIGRGGMATVWEALHLTLRVPVAVKFLQIVGPNVADITKRFLQEARVAAAIRHRNVIEIIDFGVTEERIPYMVMEFLNGESLAERLARQGSLEPTDAGFIASLVLRGLGVVHDSGIVHRDLKPENIFLVDDPDGTFPKLLDFGVSRKLGVASQLTRQGELVGTPDYMSPEQARGLRDINHRTDLYSLGVILYEMLAGRLPFESENPGDLLVMVLTEDPPPLRELRPELPGPLCAVIETAMARNPDERFESAREMRTALVAACEGLVLDERDSGLVRLSEFPRREAGSGSQVRLVPERPEGEERVSRPGRARAETPLETPAVSDPSIEVAALKEAPIVNDPSVELLVRGPTPATVVDPSVELRVRKATPEPSTVERTFRKPVDPDPSIEITASGISEEIAVGPRLPTPTPVPPPPARGSGWLVALVLGVLGGAGGFYGYQEWQARQAVEASAPVPWEPIGPGAIDLGEDAGTDAGPTIAVRLRGLPWRAEVRIDGIQVSGVQHRLPVRPEPYEIVVSRAGDPYWRVEHPGDVDGQYQVWRMTADELAGDAGEADGGGDPDAGVIDAAVLDASADAPAVEEQTPPEPEKTPPRRRWRRDRQR